VMRVRIYSDVTASTAFSTPPSRVGRDSRKVLSVMTGPINRKNRLNFGGDPVPDTDSGSLLGVRYYVTVTFRDLTLLDTANLCPAVLIMNFLFV